MIDDTDIVDDEYTTTLPLADVRSRSLFDVGEFMRPIGAGSFISLLVPWRNGPEWTSRIGGQRRAHTMLRGFVVPLPTFWAPSEHGVDPIAGAYKSRYDGRAVREFIDRCSLNDIVEPFSHGRYSMSEAWVPVIFIDSRHDDQRTDGPLGFAHALGSSCAIIVYNNSF